MKKYFLLLPLLALLPVAASAQPKPNAPQISIDPAAKALLDRAMATYKAATGLRYDQRNFVNGETLSHTRVTFAHPNRVRIDDLSSKPVTPLWLLDGTNIYAVTGTRFDKLSAESVSGVEFLDEHTVEGQFIGAMLSGESVLDLMQESSGFPSSAVRARFDFLKPRLVDGEMFSGVRGSVSARAEKNANTSSVEMTMWFDKGAMLRRIQGIITDKAKPHIVRTRIWNQQLNLEFAPDTWKFNDAGLRLLDAPNDAPRFDPRLTWGAIPPAFTAKSLDAQTISLQKYKGRVVLLGLLGDVVRPVPRRNAQNSGDV
jgi:outer membrane lipoprotein-sorting protein